MKYIVAIIVIGALYGCGFGLPAKEDYISADDFIPHINYTWENNQKKNAKFYIATVDKLMQVKEPIKYVGTIDSYHLFSVIPKRPIAPDELLNFAVLKSSCIVANPRSPEKETENRHPRWIDIVDEKIVVEKSS